MTDYELIEAIQKAGLGVGVSFDGVGWYVSVDRNRQESKRYETIRGGLVAELVVLEESARGYVERAIQRAATMRSLLDSASEVTP